MDINNRTLYLGLSNREDILSAVFFYKAQQSISENLFDFRSSCLP